jgi:hypothetical protein
MGQDGLSGFKRQAYTHVQYKYYTSKTKYPATIFKKHDAIKTYGTVVSFRLAMSNDAFAGDNAFASWLPF